MPHSEQGHDSLHVARVIVRNLSPRFADCEREDRGAVIDLELALTQHRAYVDAIRDVVGVVQELPGLSEHPDCGFVEDTAVVLNAEHVLITCPGAPSRRGEIAAVAQALRSVGTELITLPAPAFLDGGDVLRVGVHLFVGLSARTTSLGAQRLANAAQAHGLTTHVVSVPSGLHLKTGCSLADADTLLYTRGSGIDPSPFAQVGLQCVAMNEPSGGNVLALGGGHVLVSDAAPATADLLTRRGLKVRVLAMSEMHKADAAVTCSSLRLPTRGCWCT
ncbi:MAG: arginine deiminase family protein [Polyangiaceae bacterium]|jgi:dimethylargininase|nr:arginine deiminase family protein [Polyangiaceae bacterium]